MLSAGRVGKGSKGGEGREGRPGWLSAGVGPSLAWPERKFLGLSGLNLADVPESVERFLFYSCCRGASGHSVGVFEAS